MRTGNVELTSNKILERGFLDAVCTAPLYCPAFTNLPLKPSPAYYTLYPRDAQATSASGRSPATNAAASTATKPKKDSLIARYNLQDRVTKEEPVFSEAIGGKAVWEDSAEKREASLRERKAQMILAARQCVSSLISLNFFLTFSAQTAFSTTECFEGGFNILIY